MGFHNPNFSWNHLNWPWSEGTELLYDNFALIHRLEEFFFLISSLQIQLQALVEAGHDIANITWYKIFVVLIKQGPITSSSNIFFDVLHSDRCHIVYDLCSTFKSIFINMVLIPCQYFWQKQNKKTVITWRKKKFSPKRISILFILIENKVLIGLFRQKGGMCAECLTE